MLVVTLHFSSQPNKTLSLFPDLENFMLLEYSSLNAIIMRYFASSTKMI